MYRSGKIALIWAALAALPAQASPADAIETLDRVGAWDVHYADDYCDLLAEFGPKDRSVVVDFRRFLPDNQFDFTLYGKRLSGLEPRNNARLDFGLGPPIRKQAIGGHVDKLPMLVFPSVRLEGDHGKEELPPTSPETEARVSGAIVSVAGMRRFRLNFGSLGKPFAALRACETDLVKHWGFDPEVQAHLSAKPTPAHSPQSWLQSSDYPPGLSVMGINAMVQFRLDVDPRGQVTACHILYRTNDDAFADATCRALSSRAKFNPARDANGTPVRSFYVSKVMWRAG